MLVTSALRHAGYQPTKVTVIDSYRQRLLNGRSAELGRQESGEHSKDNSSISAYFADQRIRVVFDDDSAGMRRASRVQYEASSLAHPFNAVGSELVKRYGQPQASDGTGSVWCVNDSDGACMNEANHSSRLKIGHDHRGFDASSELTTIELDAGADERRAWQEAFRRRVARAMASPNAF